MRWCLSTSEGGEELGEFVITAAQGVFWGAQELEGEAGLAVALVDDDLIALNVGLGLGGVLRFFG